MSDFNINEVFQIAVNIEENGEKFYRKIAEKFKEKGDLKNLFEFLADEEVKHKRFFSEELSKIPDITPPESYPGEYFAYLESYTKNIVFKDDEIDRKLDDIENEIQAIEFGMDKEVESILYYLEIKNFVPEREQERILKIIEEERKHYVKLYNLKENYKK